MKEPDHIPNPKPDPKPFYESSLPPQDLTLPEIRTLRARQRLYFRDQSYNDKFKVRWSPGAPGCGNPLLSLPQL